MSDLRVGLIGTGAIAEAVAPAARAARGMALTHVASANPASARAFAEARPGLTPADDADALLAAVEAVYLAVPTAAKADLAARALAAGRHVLVEKPLPDLATAERLGAIAADTGALLMDATQFVNHPRTGAIIATLPRLIGRPESLVVTFHFPSPGSDAACFDRAREPMGVVGDMGWYPLRAAVAFMAGLGTPARVAVEPGHDPALGVVSADGLLGFADERRITFDVGYGSDAAVMDLTLLGPKGCVHLDDFAFDRANSIAFCNPEASVGYYHHHGRSTARDPGHFVPTPSPVSQQQLTFERFAALARSRDAAARGAALAAILDTQRLLDAVWAAVSERE